MERFTLACAKDCTTNSCTLPVKALNPLISAENVCRGALEASQPKRGIALASSLIEQAIESSDMGLLDRAEEVLQPLYDDPSRKYTAINYYSYLPLFAARVASRKPDDEELLNGFGRMQDGIDFYAAEFSKPDQDSLKYSYVVGEAGESMIMYWSLYGALEHKRTLLYPSSFREDNPPNRENAKQHKFLTHDVHTFDPTMKDEREIFSVKVRKRSPRGYIAPQLKPLVLATRVYKEMLGLPADSRGVEMTEVVDYMQQAQRREAKNHLFATSFREQCSRRLEHYVRRVDPIPTTYAQPFSR